MAKKSPQIHVFSHARWDREGLRTASEMRLHAVHVLDRLLDALGRDPARGGVVLDGQAVLFEDYLSIRTEKGPEVAAAIQTGKLLVGPWYVSPHQQLVSPESLVRNLLIGAQIARQFGDPLMVGYMPNSHAYVRQMPQILKGFGIDSVLISLDGSDPEGLMTWHGPDGSAVAAAVLVPGFSLDNAGAGTVKDFAAFAKTRLAPGAEFLLPVGFATGPENTPLADMVAELGTRLKGVKILAADLPEAIARIQAGQLPAAPIVDPVPYLTVPGCLSNRIHLKLRNQQVETLLTSWAEPFSAWAWLLDGATSAEEAVPGLMALDVTTYAWKKLLENHHQATIGGCVLDSVHTEALHRFDQAEQLAEALVAQSLQAVAESINTDLGRKQRDFLPVVVFNAACAGRTDLVAVHVRLPTPDRTYELVDETGQPVIFELSCDSASGDACTLRFVAVDVPAMGYRTCYLRPGSGGEPGPAQRDEEPSIENEFVTVTFDPLTGTLNIFDKRTGRSFSGLNHFIDEGDAGTLQEFQSPARDTVIDIATNTPIFVEREVGPVEQTLTFLQIYRLPRQLTEQRDARLPLAAQFVPVSIITQVRLVPGVPRIDVRASVANDAMDHRLKACFSLGSDSQRLFVDGHYEVRDLSEVLPAQILTASGDPATVAQRGFVTIMGADTGLTIASRGLPEVTVAHGQNGSQVALSLLRATGLLQIDEHDAAAGYIETPNAQCFGEAVFSYSLIPHGQDMLPAWHEAWAFQTGLRAVTTGKHHGALPAQASLVAVDNPRFVISAVKTGEDGRSLVVRGYSISAEVEAVTLTTGLENRAARRTRLDETPVDDPIAPDGSGGFVFEVQPAQIVTIRLEPSAP